MNRTVLLSIVFWTGSFACGGSAFTGLDPGADGSALPPAIPPGLSFDASGSDETTRSTGRDASVAGDGSPSSSPDSSADAAAKEGSTVDASKDAYIAGDTAPPPKDAAPPPVDANTPGLCCVVLSIAHACGSWFCIVAGVDNACNAPACAAGDACQWEDPATGNAFSGSVASCQ